MTYPITLICGLTFLFCFSCGASATETSIQIAGFDTDCGSDGILLMQLHHFDKGWKTISYKPVTFDNQPILCHASAYINNGKALNKLDLETALLQTAGLKSTSDQGDK